MEIVKDKNVLISGASFAGLSMAYWLDLAGYNVTIVEIAKGLKMGGTPVDIRGNTVETVKRMGLFEQIKSNRLNLELWEFKNSEDVTEGTMLVKQPGEPLTDDEFEIERNVLLTMLFDKVKRNVEFKFDNSIAALSEIKDGISVRFKDGSKKEFELVFGCDGIHSVVRKIWFGHEEKYSHFLGQYFSITIVNKSLIRQNTAQLYNVPNKAVMLNAYNNKTDIIFGFRSEEEIPYDYRDEEQQRKIILEQFKNQSWRTAELLEEVKNSKSFYFDKI